MLSEASRSYWTFPLPISLKRRRPHLQIRLSRRRFDRPPHEIEKRKENEKRLYLLSDFSSFLLEEREEKEILARLWEHLNSYFASPIYVVSQDEEASYLDKHQSEGPLCEAVSYSFASSLPSGNGESHASFLPYKIIPLTSGDKTYALLIFAWSNKRAMSELDASFVTSLSSLAGNALAKKEAIEASEKSRLFAENEHFKTTLLRSLSHETLEEKENALKEVVQEIALLGLSRTGFFSKAAFYGGTCLRLFYGLPRFSEDLDFALKQPDSAFSLQPYFNEIERTFVSFGFRVEVGSKENVDGGNIRSAFIKGGTLAHLVSVFPDSPEAKRIISNQVTKVKFEVDVNPALGAVYEEKLEAFPSLHYVTAFDGSSLFAGKAHGCRHWHCQIL